LASVGGYLLIHCIRNKSASGNGSRFVRLSETENPMGPDSEHSSHEMIRSSDRSHGGSGGTSYSAVPSSAFVISDDSSHSEIGTNDDEKEDIVSIHIES
jgi:hypothetical protein